MSESPSQPFQLSPRLQNLLTYRTLMYASIFVSGLVALTFQIVWQRYLSFLVGSEARSISLVIAVFLLGLAAGYRFWGNMTERGMSRRTMLKMVGYIELGIAGYAIAFAELFTVVKGLSYAAPDWLVVDLAITLLLLFVPTFLMGASIPLLTAAIPQDVKEVNYCHTRVYGINTLGAFAGAFIGGFLMLPVYGLPVSLLVGAMANIAVAIVFLANRVEGAVQKSEVMPSIPHSFGTFGIYCFVFTTGAVTIAFEVLFIRILGLSIGSGHYIFPIVIGVVILGLAIGSLSIRRSGVTANRVFVELLTLSALLVVLYFTVPHWPYWLSHVRISLVTMPSNYGVFLFFVVVFTALLLLPIVIPMGRLLPIGYSLVDKTSSDYGKVCGRVYFVNTAGTVFGAVGLGYAMFHWLSLEQIFKLNIALILGLTAYLFLRQRSTSPAIVCGVLAGAVFFLPAWNRTHHEFGIFRLVQPTELHFQGWLQLPPYGTLSTKSFTDDPSSTVTVNESAATPRRPYSRAIVVNGKSDGDTIGDFSNMMLTGILPYLYAPKQADLDAVVVGLGTGMTTGVLAAADDVNSVTTLEISSGVIDALPLFDDFTFNVSSNPKSTIVHTDAFRFFARARQGYDLIISEPSNPWVVGVDNLFTTEYYELASRVMNEGAIFFQWVQIYEMDNEVFAAIVKNVVHEFPHVRMYVIGNGDVGIVASHQPLTEENHARRFQHHAVESAMVPMGLDGNGPLHLLRMYDTEQLRSISHRGTQRFHSLNNPWLGHRAGRARFLARSVTLGRMLQQELARHLPASARWRDEVHEWMDEHYETWINRCMENPGHSMGFVCSRVEFLHEFRAAVRGNITIENASEVLEAYNNLRVPRLIDADPQLLGTVNELLLESWPHMTAEARQQLTMLLIQEYAYEWQWQSAADVVNELFDRNWISVEHFEEFKRQINGLRDATERLIIIRHEAQNVWPQ